MTQSKFYKVALLMVAFLGWSVRHYGQPASLKVGGQAPPLVVQEWLKGTPVKAFNKGHIYVLEFGATHCAPCRAIAPRLTELSKQYQDKVTFISMHIWENDKNKRNDLAYVKKVKRYLEAMGDKIGFAVAVDMPGQDSADAWMKAAGKSAIPTTFIIDGLGKIVWIGSPFSMDLVLEQIVAGTFDLLPQKKEQKVNNKKLKAGDPAPLLTVSKWLKGQPVTFAQPSPNPHEAYIVFLTNRKIDMRERKSLHLMMRLAQEYAGKVSVIWVYSKLSQEHKEMENFIEEQGDEINYSVALDTPEGTSYNNWNKAAGNGETTAFVIDSSFHIAWIGRPADTGAVLKGVMAGQGIETGNQVNQRGKEVFATLNSIIKSRNNGDPRAQVKMDSLMAANPENQNLYWHKYLYFLSHGETQEDKEKAKAWLILMLETMPEGYFYWEDILLDIGHAFTAHKHDYFDQLIAVVDRVIAESETPELSTNFIRHKAQLYAEFKGENGGPARAAEILNRALRDPGIALKPEMRPILFTDYYLYKLQSSTGRDPNSLLEGILHTEVEGLQYERLIEYILGLQRKADHELLLQIANRYVKEASESSKYGQQKAKALACLAKVYDDAGEINKAYRSFQEALKISEQTKNQKITKIYGDLLNDYKQKHALN